MFVWGIYSLYQYHIPHGFLPYPRLYSQVAEQLHAAEGCCTSSPLLATRIILVIMCQPDTKIEVAQTA